MWKIQDFTFATFLDLNRQCYLFELDKETTKCAELFFHGGATFMPLPQGFMTSSDIFQGHMAKIFYNVEVVIAYTDNIFLLTKHTFEHQFKHLAQILERIKSQNLHIMLKKLSLHPKKLITLVIPFHTKALNHNTR